MPAPPLRPYIEALWCVSSEGSVAPPNAGASYPDGRIELVIPLADPLERGDALISEPIVVGQASAATFIKYSGIAEIVGVRFTATGASAILREDVSAFTSSIVGVRDICPRLAQSLGCAVDLRES